MLLPVVPGYFQILEISDVEINVNPVGIMACNYTIMALDLFQEQ